MRTLKRDDRGAVLVWVGLLLVVLFGMGALVVDAGALYSERRQLQNGADAAALAVAADCATGDCLDESATANTYADKNANDGAANIDEVCGSGPGLAACPTPPSGTAGASGWVRVKTSTHNPANSNDKQVDFVLAPVLSAANVGKTVHASAVAAWGSVGGATTLPISFSVCEYKNLGGALDGSVFPTGHNYIYLHGNSPPPDALGSQDCPSSPSGQDGPGGFGWLQPSVGCATTATFDRWTPVSTGRPAPCNLGLELEHEYLIPLYDGIRDTGHGMEYHIAGFVGFKLLGYKFQNTGSISRCRTQDNLAEMPASVDCIFAEFTLFTTDSGSFGGGTDYGARSIKMIG